MDRGHLSGCRVVLRRAGDADLEALCALFSEPEVWCWWGRYDRDRIEREMLGDDPMLKAYVIEVGAEVVGFIQSWDEPDPEFRKASIDMAVARRWWGTGVAVDALRTLARHLMDDEGHHHLTIDPAVDNGRAIACYRKVGFRPVGVLRQNARGPDGTFRDTLLMDLVAGELIE